MCLLANCHRDPKKPAFRLSDFHPFREPTSVQHGSISELKSFLKPINAEAYRSLNEAGENLLALHRLNVPNTLHRSLLSTNAIENSFLNTRRKIGRVTRFRAETDQASRWLSYALLEAEKGFRRIRGHADLQSFIAALSKSKKFAGQKTPYGTNRGEVIRSGERVSSSAA